MILRNCVSNFYFTVLGVAGFPRSGGSGKPQVWSAGEASPVLILNNTWRNGEYRIIINYRGSMAVKYSVIVALDNRYELTTNFIETLVSTTDFSDGELIIIVDGCKDKDTLDYLEQIKAQLNYVYLIIIDEQSGYSIANNTAVAQSDGDILVFINSDVLLCNGSIEELVNFINNDPSIGAAQGRLIYPQNNRIQSTGHLFIGQHNSHVYKGKPSNHPLVLEKGIRQALTTAFCAIRRSVFNSFGGFSENYFNAYEGMELTLKITYSGLKCIYYPDAVAYHITGATRSNMKFSNELAGKIFWAKWSDKIRRDISDYIKPQITDKIRNQVYFIIDCGSLPDWDFTLEEISITSSGKIKIRDRHDKSIDLYCNLPFATLHYSGAYLFLCDDILALRGNYNWCSVRNNSLDLVIDSHGNVESLHSVVGISDSDA